MANYIWTKSNIEKLSELYKAGEPRRVIQDEIGCTAGVLAVQMAKMPATRQPIDNDKFAQIEAGFFNRKNSSLHTPIRL
jgi:ribosomal protein L11 methylase PrmA